MTVIFRYRNKKETKWTRCKGLPSFTDTLVERATFQKLLSKEPDAQYRSEQGKILTILWKQELGCATATDIALATGLANNTLTSMVKKLEEQGLVTIQPCTQDKRKKYISLTDPRLGTKGNWGSC